ncbi:peptidylprolyl isomerase [Candidatus Woesearchaeota archaeon]|nr:peptidylprolyl isomerase [Candidatus Woesearchaeota archaeon]
MVLKEKDFIELDFVARDKETNKIFDLTDETLAKKEKLYNKDMSYGPVTICLGENQIIKGIDFFLIGKEINKEYKVEIKPEEGFGKKDPKLLRLIPLKIFKKQNIVPFPGLQVNIDGLFGIVRTVSSGRSIVDFNHPLAGHELIYEVKVNRLVTDDKEKVVSLLTFFLKSPEIELKEGTLTIKSKITEPIQKMLEERIKKLIPGVKEIKFENK